MQLSQRHAGIRYICVASVSCPDTYHMGVDSYWESTIRTEMIKWVYKDVLKCHVLLSEKNKVMCACQCSLYTRFVRSTRPARAILGRNLAHSMYLQYRVRWFLRLFLVTAVAGHCSSQSDWRAKIRHTTRMFWLLPVALKQVLDSTRPFHECFGHSYIVKC